jgi:hypothetical protein
VPRNDKTITPSKEGAPAQMFAIRAGKKAIDRPTNDALFNAGVANAEGLVCRAMDLSDTPG